MLKYYLILYFISCFFNYAEACLPGETHIREQWVNAYIKNDGTEVSAQKR
jgi:hypothetical protein